MNSILEKTCRSLEAALRYNPNSLELMTSLAEVYVRLGRFDRQTLELCETVLTQKGDNALLQQAQVIGMMIDQSRAMEDALAEGQEPPDCETLASSIEILDEFLHQTPDCAEAWIAWTRFQLIAGNMDQVRRGAKALEGLGCGDLCEHLSRSMLWATRRRDWSREQIHGLAVVCETLGKASAMIACLEDEIDGGRDEVCALLLEFYLHAYTPGRANEVPVPVRSRFFSLLLDCGDLELLAAWLRAATTQGWEISGFSKDYARCLIRQGELDEAFASLQRLVMDQTVKEMLNEIALGYEQRDEVDKAVDVLRYINDHALSDTAARSRQESDLTREAELSLAELNVKNGRYEEAFEKFVAALCLSPQVDVAILDRLEELIETTRLSNPDPLLRAGLYFHEHQDQPKAIFFLNRAQQIAPGNQAVMQAQESIYRDILKKNPDLPKVRMELGRLYLQTGRADQAIEHLQLAKAAPNLALEAGRLLAEALHNAGQLTKALDQYRALPVEPQIQERIYELGVTFMQRQEHREALTALDLVARINPGFRDVAERVRVLEEGLGKLQPEVVTDPKMRELIGDLAVGRYQYLDRVGSGGMGVVHKVYDLRNQQTVAMKILRDSLSGSSKALDRFFREARIAASISHPNIVKIYDYNISNVSGQSYIVMEFVDGPSLREVVDRQFQEGLTITLDYVAEILYYAVQLCDALEAAHNKGIVHRDIKPDNIMVTRDGIVKITDFGIVHIEEATFTPSGAMLGTPRYMAPEQVTGGKIDGRSDIYAVGILLYETLLGSPPFMTGDISYQQVHNPPVAPREINPIVPQKVEEAILQCLAKKPEDRFASAHGLKRSLSGLLDDLGGCSKYACQTIVGAEPPQIGNDDDLDMD